MDFGDLALRTRVNYSLDLYADQRTEWTYLRSSDFWRSVLPAEWLPGGYDDVGQTCSSPLGASSDRMLMGTGDWNKTGSGFAHRIHGNYGCLSDLGNLAL